MSKNKPDSQQLAITHNVLLVYRVDGALDANVPLSVVGSAIYDLMILMNHSCAANTTRFYQDGTAVLVAKRDVKKARLHPFKNCSA